MVFHWEINKEEYSSLSPEAHIPVRSASSVSTACFASSIVKHIGGLNFKIFL